MSPISVPNCANPACESPRYCAGSGQFFRLEIPNAREAPEPASREAISNFQKRPRLRVEDYWLCADCAEIYTLSYDREAHIVLGTKRPQPFAEPELELAGNFLPSS